MLATGSTHAWWPKNIWGLNCCLLFTTVILEFENDIPYFPWMFWSCVFLSSSWIAGDTPCSSTWLDVPIRRVISRLWQQSPPVLEENEYPDELLLTSHRVSMDFFKYCRSMLPSLISFTNSYAEEAILIEYLYIIHVMWKASKSGNAAWNLDVHVKGRLKEPVLHILDGSVGSNLWTALFLSKLTTPCMTFREVMIECWALGLTKKENPIFVMHWCCTCASFIHHANWSRVFQDEKSVHVNCLNQLAQSFKYVHGPGEEKGGGCDIIFCSFLHFYQVTVSFEE